MQLVAFVQVTEVRVFRGAIGEMNTKQPKQKKAGGGQAEERKWEGEEWHQVINTRQVNHRSYLTKKTMERLMMMMMMIDEVVQTPPTVLYLSMK